MAKDAEYLRAKSTLTSWSFIKEYNKHEEKYKEVAEIALITLKSSGVKIGSNARTYVQYVTAALQYTNLWSKALQSKRFLKFSDRPIMSERMALYILEENWPII